MEPIELTTFDTEHGLDNIKGNGAITRTTCDLDPEHRQVTVYQRDSDTAITFYRWHGREFSINLDADETDDQPAPDALREFLTSAEGQEVLDEIIDGYESWWDGNNTRGRLTDEGEAALSRIERAIADLPRDQRTWWTCEEWFGGEERSYITPAATEEEIAFAAANATQDAATQVQAFADDPERYLRQWVEARREEEWSDLWYASDYDGTLEGYKLMHDNDLAAARKAESQD